MEEKPGNEKGAKEAANGPLLRAERSFPGSLNVRDDVTYITYLGGTVERRGETVFWLEGNVTRSEVSAARFEWYFIDAPRSRAPACMFEVSRILAYRVRFRRGYQRHTPVACTLAARHVHVRVNRAEAPFVETSIENGPPLIRRRPILELHNRI